MVIAVKNKQVEMARLLYNNKCDINYKDPNGNSFLHIVSDDDGLEELVKAFVDFGSDLDAKNLKGQTPLHLAAESGKDNLEVVIILVESGADVNAVSNKGETPRKAAKGIKVKKYLKDQGGVRKVKK
jgi:ankyrin repeat protein